MPLLVAVAAAWLPATVLSCTFTSNTAPASSHCQHQPLKNAGLSAPRPACHEVTAQACGCTDVSPAVVQMTSAPSAAAAPVSAMAALWELPATQPGSLVAYDASPPTPLESILANRVLLI